MTAPERACLRCSAVHPITTKFWTPKDDCSDGFVRICRKCDNAARRERKQQKRIAAGLPPFQARGTWARKRIRGGCVTCEKMPWRVVGPKCKECGLRRAAEPRPEFELRRYYDMRAHL